MASGFTLGTNTAKNTHYIINFFNSKVLQKSISYMVIDVK